MPDAPRPPNGIAPLGDLELIVGTLDYAGVGGSLVRVDVNSGE